MADDSAVGIIKVQTLEKHYDLFERSTDCSIILGNLRMCGMISPLEMQRLQAETTQMERNRCDTYTNKSTLDLIQPGI